MFNKDLKENIKDDVISELINEYKKKRENLENECQVKYKEYRKIRTELELVNYNIKELENNDSCYSNDDEDDDFYIDTEVHS